MPKLTPRQWFWTLLCVAFLWSFLGFKTAPRTDSNGPEQNKPRSFMQTLQLQIKKPINTIITPGQWLAAWVERGFVATIGSFTSVRLHSQSVEALSERIRQLDEEREVALQTILDLRNQLAQYDATASLGIKPRDLLPANIKGYGPGPNANTVDIDKGTNNGIPGGIPKLVPVISSFRIVGRIDEPMPLTASVRLLSHPKSGIRAKIIHRSDRSIIAEGCFVQGNGDGTLICNSIEKAKVSIPIEKGDLVVLQDTEWPRPLQNFIIGEVTEPNAPSDSPLRYSIKIKPSINITTLQSVDVLIRH